MSKKETDILLIRKYLNGELDARAMHQLEMRAQDDPFLMDALEGYEKAATDQQANLSELNSRLQKRVTQKQRRIIPYRTLAIAASVLVIFTIGWLWLSNDHKPEQQTNAKIAEPVAKPAPATPITADKSTNNQIAANPVASVVVPDRKASGRSALRKADASDKIQADNMIASAAPALIKADSVAEDTTPLNEMVVMNYTAPKKNDTKAAAPINKLSEAKVLRSSNTERALQSKVDGVTTTPAGYPFGAQSSSKIILQGRIVDKNDGMALPGVSIRVPGTTFGALSDINGKFSIPVDSTKSNIVIAYLGYNTVKMNVRNRDSLKTIRLEPTSSALNEVVVTGYSSQKKADESEIAAHPQAGWHSYKKYLNDNAISPDGKAGIVKLSFMVDRNGEISEVTVSKGLSPATNAKAIDLINNGPYWTGSSTRQTEQVTIRVKFTAK